MLPSLCHLQQPDATHHPSNIGTIFDDEDLSADVLESMALPRSLTDDATNISVEKDPVGYVELAQEVYDRLLTLTLLHKGPIYRDVLQKLSQRVATALKIKNVFFVDLDATGLPPSVLDMPIGKIETMNSLLDALRVIIFQKATLLGQHNTELVSTILKMIQVGDERRDAFKDKLEFLIRVGGPRTASRDHFSGTWDTALYLARNFGYTIKHTDSSRLVIAEFFVTLIRIHGPMQWREIELLLQQSFVRSKGLLLMLMATQEWIHAAWAKTMYNQEHVSRKVWPVSSSFYRYINLATTEAGFVRLLAFYCALIAYRKGASRQEKYLQIRELVVDIATRPVLHASPEETAVKEDWKKWLKKHVKVLFTRLNPALG